MKVLLIICLFCFSIAGFSQTTDSIYTNVDHLPEFPGGNTEMLHWITTNLTFPTTTDDDWVSHFSVSFVVETDGRLTEIRVLRGGSQEINRCIAGTIKSMPRWKPASTGNGNVVRFRYHLPVNICLK